MLRLKLNLGFLDDAAASEHRLSGRAKAPLTQSATHKNSVFTTAVAPAAVLGPPFWFLELVITPLSEKYGEAAAPTELV